MIGKVTNVMGCWTRPSHTSDPTNVPPISSVSNTALSGEQAARSGYSSASTHCSTAPSFGRPFARRLREAYQAFRAPQGSVHTDTKTSSHSACKATTRPKLPPDPRTLRSLDIHRLVGDLDRHFTLCALALRAGNIHCEASARWTNWSAHEKITMAHSAFFPNSAVARWWSHLARVLSRNHYEGAQHRRHHSAHRVSVEHSASPARAARRTKAALVRCNALLSGLPLRARPIVQP